MRYSLILILSLNLLVGQSIYNRFLGSDTFRGSARSVAMGETHLISVNSSDLIRFNPAGLAIAPSSFNGDFQLDRTGVLERRSIPMGDSFGDFLTDADYVMNRTSRYDFSGSLTYTFQSELLNVGFGVNHYPLSSFDFYYEEEVRGSYSLADGEIANKDPLAGFHVLQTEGDLYTTGISAGMGFELENRISLQLGVGYHHVYGSEIFDLLHIDTLYSDDTNLANFNNFEHSFKTPESSFLVNSIQLSIGQRLSIAYSMESRVHIQVEPYSVNFDSTMGVFVYLHPDSSDFQIQGLNYTKPNILSAEIQYTAPGYRPITLALGYDYIDSEEADYLVDMFRWKFGFEFLTELNTPVRAGLVFQGSPLISVPSTTIFTAGTGKTFKSLTCDIAVEYQLISFSHPDLFPVENDIREEYDKVTESRLNVLLNLSYHF